MSYIILLSPLALLLLWMAVSFLVAHCPWRFDRSWCNHSWGTASEGSGFDAVCSKCGLLAYECTSCRGHGKNNWSPDFCDACGGEGVIYKVYE